MENLQHVKTNEELQLVIFRLANEEYGLPIAKVHEINRLSPITKLPQTPSFMEGVTNLRGKIIPVFDLRKRFQLPVIENSDDTRIIIVAVKDQVVGIIVDAVNEVIKLPASAVEPPPPVFVLDTQYIHGVGKMDDRLLILLDMDKILNTQEEILLQEMKRQ
ncbi:MAG: cheW 2 [Firmicutes bacterium]|nr:cheW 2 [Bacillota bacterium]